MSIQEFREKYRGTAEGFIFDLALAESIINNTDLLDNPLIKIYAER